ncbi:hypothetical protein B0A49_12576 [Cryomyces minteri]|uniref:SWI/SNF-related matrix-associated actin-dependent regulator of chromatin subfamily A member 3-like 1 n=1 Tax=Cryomyces minteri TaxID=331657 RepID=A0A4U0WGB3_9PEZI|nr:hypothetical protein B0A49_12576 [Cryomyces minteri]
MTHEAGASKKFKSPNGDVAASQTPRYDPKALLNPKGAAKRSRDLDGTGEEEVVEATPATKGYVRQHKEQQELGMGSMIERVHNVGKREDQPQKRVKTNHNADEETDKKVTFEGGGGKGGVIGEYMRQQKEEGKQAASEAGPPATAASSSVVDLTADDDDIVVISDSGNQEICLGQISAQVMAWMVPTQKSGSFVGHSTKWPMMKVSLSRPPGTNNFTIVTSDPAGKEFGKLDVRSASALAPLMQGVRTNKMRMQSRLEMRNKVPGQFPGQPTSDAYALSIHLYAPRRVAVGLGRFLSQRQIWLRSPTMVDRGIEVFNPHAPKVAPPLPKFNISGMNISYGALSYVTRTVEEIRNDIQGMFDTLTKTEDLVEKQPNERVITSMLSHQKQALHFMSERENEREILSESDDNDPASLWRIKYRPNGQKMYFNVITGNESEKKPPPVLGGILADMMGLGKTLSILSLVCETLTEAEVFAQQRPLKRPADEVPLILNSKATLLVSPVSVVANWEEQIKAHIRPKGLSYYIYHGPNRNRDIAMLGHYDLVITTYSVVASEFGESALGKKPLEQVNWFRIVLDEAHMIRNQSNKQSQAICSLAAQRRWAVTGTPVQNRLDDLGALIKFLRIKPFDEKGAFVQFIMAPFKSADPEILPKLRLLVDSITLRRLKDRIDLPARHEQIVRLNFSDEERALYECFAKDSAQKVNAVTGQDKGLQGRAYVHILRAILRLRQICAHGREMLTDEDMKIVEGISYSNAIDLGDEDDEERPALNDKQAYDMLNLLRESDMDRCWTCKKKIGPKDADSDDDTTGNSTGRNGDAIGYMTPCYQILCPICIDGFRKEVERKATADNHVVCPLCEQYVRVCFFELSQEKIEEDEEQRAMVRANPKLAKQVGRYHGPHTKTKALLEELRESQAWSVAHSGEAPMKSVIFSGWTSHLDLIQIALEDHGISFTRLDGTMRRPQRAAALTAFREDSNVTVILVSISAGGLGLNLTTGSKVYVMEPQYNPAAEAQAVDRVHRLGQTREVEITRYIMADSFEEKMLILQKKKRDLADLSMNRNVKLDKAESAKARLEELRSLFR